ncbi:MAG: RNA polymerase sigma factor [Gammaproteobacteria bacterium]
MSISAMNTGALEISVETEPLLAAASRTVAPAAALTATPFRQSGVPRKVLPMVEVDDGELMLRYARGDLRAFETLYRRHRSPLYRYLARHTRDPEVANDIFQEVWSRVISSRSRYEPRAKFSTFLYRIAHNCFIDHCRRSASRHDRANVSNEDFDLEKALPAPLADLPDTRAEHAQTLTSYRAALAALPAEQRDTFLLYEESGLTLEEIGSITGVSMETAKSRLRYALSKLRHALGALRDSGSSRVTAVGEPGA